MAEPLRMRFSTQDPEEMLANLAVTGPDTIIEKRRTGRFSANVDAVRLDGLALMRISTRNVRVFTEPGGTYTSLNIPLRGGFEINRFRRCEHYDHGFAYLQNLDRPFDFSAADTSVLVANCDNPILFTMATKFGGGEQELAPDLHKKLSLSSESGVRLWRAVCSLWLLAGKEHDPPASALAIAEGEKEVAAALLLAAGIDEGPPLSVIDRRRSIAALKRVEDWIVANLDQPICRADLCAVSGLQLRALTRAFAKYHAEAPMQFVRDRRLEAVYRMLLGSESGEVTVTRAATDAGFYHLSRFAADYFAAFGEHPSETLHG